MAQPSDGTPTLQLYCPCQEGSEPPPQAGRCIRGGQDPCCVLGLNAPRAPPVHSQPFGHHRGTPLLWELLSSGCSAAVGLHGGTPPPPLTPPTGRKRQCGPLGNCAPARSAPAAPFGAGSPRRAPGAEAPTEPPHPPPPLCRVCSTRPRQQRVMGTGTGSDGDKGEMGT